MRGLECIDNVTGFLPDTVCVCVCVCVRERERERERERDAERRRGSGLKGEYESEKSRRYFVL